MPAEPIKLIIVKNPVDVRSREITYIPYRRQRLKTLHRKYMADRDNLIVHINQYRLTVEEQKTWRLKPGDEVIMIPVIGEGFSIAAVASILATGPTSFVIWKAILTMGLLYGTAQLVRALGPNPIEPDFGGDSQTYRWNPVTTQQQGLIIPRAYGENKLYGNVISGWTVPAGADETIFVLLSLGKGPVEGIVADSIQIQDQSIGNFSGVTTYERKGTFNQSAIFNSRKIPYRPYRTVSSTSPEVWTTPDNDFDKLEIALEYSGFHYRKSGKRGSQPMDIKIEISEKDAGTWNTLCDLTYDTDISPKQENYISDQTYTGGSPVTITKGTRYDIRVTKVTADADIDRSKNDLKLASVREVISTAFIDPGLAILGIEALATGQISGSLKISCIQKGRIVNVYNGTTWSLEYSTNPAWVIWDVMTQPVISGDGGATPYAIERYDGIDPARLTPNLAEFFSAAQWYDNLVSDGEGGTEKRITFNGVFDAQTNLWNAVKEVEAMARCEVIPDGINYTIIVDKAWTTAPVQLFSAGNIKQGTFSQTYLSLDSRAAEIELNYLDAAADYERVPLTYFDTDIDNPARKISLKGLGVTSGTQAWRMVYYELAKNRLMKMAATFEADVDAIVCEKGDVINVIPSWEKDGRIVSCPNNNQVIIDGEHFPSSADTIVVRVHDPATGADSIEERTVSSIVGNLVTISGTWTINPSVDNVYAFGPTADVAKKFRVIGVNTSGELTHKLTVAEYHAGIYTGDDGEPVIPIASYVTPQSAPIITRPMTTDALHRMYPDELLREPNIDVPLTTNLKWNNNAPSAGYVSWSKDDASEPITLIYKGVLYEITLSNTNLEYIYWDLSSPTVFSSTDTLATAIGVDKWVMCENDGGTTYPTFGSKIIHGGLIQADTIVTSQILITGKIGEALASEGSSLLPNGRLDIGDTNGRPAGIYPVVSITDFSGLDWLDSSEAEINIAHASDETIGYGFPAIPIDDKQKYRIVIRHKAPVSSGNGLYLRMYQYNAALPAGKTHVGEIANGGTEGGPNCIERTNSVDLVSNGPFPGGPWQVDEYTYTPTSGTKYASFAMLNWAGAGTKQYHVDYVLMFLIPKTADEIGDGSTYGIPPKNWMHGSDVTLIDGGKIYTKSITAATGAIGDLAVNTLQIANEAVTLGVSAYTEGSIGSGDVQDITIETSGQPVNIIATVRVYGYRSAADCFNNVDCWEDYNLKLIRDTTEIYSTGQIWFMVVNGQWGLVTVGFRDTPGAGTYTYKINMTLASSYAKRFLSVQEVKK